MAKIYNINKTQKTCGYAYWDIETKKMCPCGKNAHGEIKRISYCVKHFEFAMKMYGIHPKEVTHER